MHVNNDEMSDSVHVIQNVRTDAPGETRQINRRASLVDRMKGMFSKKPIENVERNKSLFTPGFGHKGQGLQSRGRRVETIDEERTTAALQQQAKDRLEEKRLADERISKEIIEDSKQERKVYQDIMSLKRASLPHQGFFQKILSNFKSPTPAKPIEGHDEMMRAKIKQSTSSAIGRRIAGFLMGVDVSLRPHDPEFKELQQKKELEASEAKASAEKETAAKLKREAFLAEPPPKSQKILSLEFNLEALKVRHAEAELAHEQRVDIYKQVIDAYTHAPQRGKRIKLPPHHQPEAWLPDRDQQLLLHESTRPLTAFEKSIPGVDKLITERPELFEITKNEEWSKTISALQDNTNGYDYDSHIDQIRREHEKDLKRKVLASSEKHLDASIESKDEHKAKALGPVAQQVVEKVKERNRAVLQIYQDTNIPNPWREQEGIRSVQPTFQERDLTDAEVQAKYDFRNYIPGHFSQYRDEKKIYSFPPVADQVAFTMSAQEKKRKQRKKAHDEVEYDYTPGHDNNAATNAGARYTWDHETQQYIVPPSCSFKDNNPRLEVFKPATTDVLDKALYKYRPSVQKTYPESAILPSRADLAADTAKRMKDLQKLNKPFVTFKKSAVDLGRVSVRIAVNDPINIKKAQKKIMKKLQLGIINRLEFDAEMAALMEGQDVRGQGVALPDFYGDYPDDEYNSEDSDSFSDNGEEGTLASVSVSQMAHEQIPLQEGILVGSVSTSLSGAPASLPLKSPVEAADGSSIGGENSVVGSVLGSVVAHSKASQSSRRSRKARDKNKIKTNQNLGIISSITEPIIPMKVLLTMGTGGKYADRVHHEPLQSGAAESSLAGSNSVVHQVLTDRPNRGHVHRPPKPIKDPMLSSEKDTTKVDNTIYLTDIDRSFNTDKKQLIDQATKNNLELTDTQVQAVGDLYKDETRTMVAQRQLFEEDSLPSARQLVRVKMARHRSALKLDRKHISLSHSSTKDWGLESIKTTEARREKVHSKRLIQAKLEEVKVMMRDAKKQAEAEAHERERERNRQGIVI